MRISELSEATAVSVATIKFYLREGLLPPGHKVGERRAEYEQTHARRLRLLRALREVGQVPVERLRALVEAVDDTESSVHEMFAAASDAIGPGLPPPGPDSGPARAAADDMVARAGWTGVGQDSLLRNELAAILEAMRVHGFGDDPESATPYLEVADRLARLELDTVRPDADRVELMERMVLGQVLAGRMLLTLRRLAQAHHSAVRFGQPGEV